MHGRSWFQAPPMLIHKYMDENGLTAMHGHQDVSRCFTRGESDDSVASKQQSMQARCSTLAFKPKADVT